MPKNYTEELKEMLEKFKNKGIDWGKDINYLEFRNGCSREEMMKEILDCSNAEYVEKQKTHDEIRYKIYYIYSSRTGRVYVITFRDKIRVITIYPLSSATAKNCKRKFKKSL